MIDAPATLAGALLILAFPQPPPATEAPPAVLGAYIKDGVFSPGDYRWMRGRFDDASPADKLAYAEVKAWKKRCFEAGTQRVKLELKALGVDPTNLESGPYGDAVCAHVASATPSTPTVSWAAFEHDLAAARPYADSFLFAVLASGSGQSPDPSLSARLLFRPIAEQMARRAMSWGAGPVAEFSPKLSDGVRPIVMALIVHRIAVEDRANTRWLDDIVRKDGWPKLSEVGEGASKMAWLLAQHADHEPAFQLRVLRAMEPMVKAGETKPADYGYLYDRIMLKIAGRQRYATQMTCAAGKRVPRPLEDAAAVDRYRAEVKLAPLADYMMLMDKNYGPCPAK